MTGGSYAGYVLAGGRSSRMGTDKALLVFHGRTLLERAAEAVREAAGSVTLIGERQRYGAFGFPVIGDARRGCGPLGGIHAALCHSSAVWNLVAACDMPGLEAGALRDLLDQTRRHAEADVILPESKGQAQPLCAVYRRTALPAIERAIDSARWKILDAIQPLHVVRVARNDEALFRNCNTPEEWNALVR